MLIQEQWQFRQRKILGAESALNGLIWCGLGDLSFDVVVEQW